LHDRLDGAFNHAAACQRQRRLTRTSMRCSRSTSKLAGPRRPPKRPLMRHTGGAIVNTSSIGSWRADPTSRRTVG
jgi:hypothetical protein